MRDGKYQEIDEAVYQWYCLARDAMVPINGPMIQEEATETAKKLNKPAKYDGFKASSGWLKVAMGLSSGLLKVNQVRYNLKQWSPGSKG